MLARLPDYLGHHNVRRVRGGSATMPHENDFPLIKSLIHFFVCDITPNHVGEIRIFPRLSELVYRLNNMNKNVIGEMDMMMVLIIT